MGGRNTNATPDTKPCPLCAMLSDSKRLTMEAYNTFEKENHLTPFIEKEIFDKLHGWDFGWAILETINIPSANEDEIAFSKKLSPGQKALYFFWYLDAQVTNGGFIQFYWNEYDKYLMPIIDGLKLINDTDMLTLVEKANNEILTHNDYFFEIKEKGDPEPLYDNLYTFDTIDETYYSIHEHTMDLLEKYIRENHSEFVKLK